jgi:hypothetical protein
MDDRDALPETCDPSQEHLPWKEYDQQSDEDVLRKLARKTQAIYETDDYDQIEDATAAAAAVVNHERQKESPRERILEQAYKDYRAGMTAN